ncbi:MAG: hypothetical protein ACFFDH_04415 [Promethearchaeota archaeon]
MDQIKGSIFQMIVRSIKANHNKVGEYESILSDKAKEFLNKRILSGSWYPLEVYRELYDTLCFIEAKNNPKILHQWGVVEAQRSLSTIYRSLVVKGDLKRAIEKYKRFHSMVYTFGDVLPKIISNNEIIVTYKDTPRDWENWYQMITGFVTKFFELCFDKEVNYTFLSKSWNGGDWTEIRYSWAS